MNTSTLKQTLITIAATLFCFGTGVTVAAQETQNPGTNADSPAKKYFTDVVLVNQNGEKMRFYSDLLRGKVVIINSFFATCAGSCLPLIPARESHTRSLGAASPFGIFSRVVRAICNADPSCGQAVLAGFANRARIVRQMRLQHDRIARAES